MCEFSVSASLPSPLSGHMLKFSLLKNISSNPASSSSHLLKGLTFIATNIYLSLYFLERAVFLEIHWKEKSRNLPMITHSFYHLNAYFPLFAYMETFFFWVSTTDSKFHAARPVCFGCHHISSMCLTHEKGSVIKCQMHESHVF